MIGAYDQTDHLVLPFVTKACKSDSENARHLSYSFAVEHLWMSDHVIMHPARMPYRELQALHFLINPC